MNSVVLERPGSRPALKTVIQRSAATFQVLGAFATALGAEPANQGLFLAAFAGWFALALFWRNQGGALAFHTAFAAVLLGLTAG